MLQFTLPTERALQSPRALTLSLTAHGVAIFLLLAIRFTSSVSNFPSVPQRFILIAPATPIKRQITTPLRREFHPPPPAPVHLDTLATLRAPVVEAPKAILPEIPAIPAAASAPIIKAFDVKPAAPTPAPKPVIKPSGFESTESAPLLPAPHAVSATGSFESAHPAEGAPKRGAIARSAGFSDGADQAGGAIRRGSITNAAFGDTTVERNASPMKQTAAAPRVMPVEILSKPKPAYTAEARANNIEGEVLLEVHFNASGEVRILRVVRGLGHGLDETAVAAAQGIRFRPATLDGAAVDSTALVHILFQLAN